MELKDLLWTHVRTTISYIRHILGDVAGDEEDIENRIF
jgi:hypothetical protein